MRTLYLHVGHAKTGSSYLQSALALSLDALARGGIYYPDLTNSFETASAGLFTSGNVHANRKPLIAYARDAHELAPEGQALLFSNEGMFGNLLLPAAPQYLTELQEAGFEVRVLCFIRDPMDHAVSVYQQLVKRRCCTKELGEFLEDYAVPREVQHVMGMMNSLGIKLQVSNYTRHRHDLLDELQNWLGLEQGSLTIPPRSVINRSLTAGELRLQLAFNRFYGEGASGLISDALCNNLPDVSSDYPALREGQLAPFLDRMRGLVTPVTALLPESEHYQVPEVAEAIARFRNPDDPQLLSFSQEQLDVIARRLSNHFKALKESAKT